MVAPPSRAYLGRRGMYHLPSVVLNAFKDMLRKHCKFHFFWTSYWFCFDDRYSLIRENRKKNKNGFRFSFELCSLQNYTPSAGFVTYTSPKPA